MEEAIRRGLLARCSAFGDIKKEIYSMQKYSPSTGWIYPVEKLSDYIKAGTLPDDLLDITDDERSEVYTGKKLSIGEGGVRIWSFPPPTLSQVVGEKMGEINAAYIAEITGCVEYPTASGIYYQGDRRSLDALLIRLQLGTDPPYWRAKNNDNTAPFTVADVEALAELIELRAAAAVEKLHSRKDAVLGIVAQVEAEKAEAGAGISEADGIELIKAIVW